jgi:hypothetical protein
MRGQTTAWLTRIIQNSLVATLGEESLAYRTKMKSLCERVSPGNIAPLSDVTSAHIDDSDERILRVLEELPFSSVRQLLCAIRRPKTTVYRQLYEKLAVTPRHLRYCHPGSSASQQTYH